MTATEIGAGETEKRLTQTMPQLSVMKSKKKGKPHTILRDTRHLHKSDGLTAESQMFVSQYTTYLSRMRRVKQRGRGVATGMLLWTAAKPPNVSHMTLLI